MVDPTKNRWQTADVIRVAATAAAGALLTAFIGVNVEKAAQDRHWDNFLSRAIEKMSGLSPYVSTWCFWFALGLFVGVAISFWVLKYLPERRLKSSLEVVFDPTSWRFSTPDTVISPSGLQRRGHHYSVEVVNHSHATLERVAVFYSDLNASDQHEAAENDPIDLDPGQRKFVRLFFCSYEPDELDEAADLLQFEIKVGATARNIPPSQFLRLRFMPAHRHSEEDGGPYNVSIL
jgi:hypothetical protein